MKGSNMKTLKRKAAVAAFGAAICLPTLAFGQNFALFGTATQSTTDFGGVASNAIDGNLGNFTHTAAGDTDQWWELDLGESRTFADIEIYNRSNCCSGRLRDFTVQVFDVDGTTELYNSGVLNVDNVDGGGIDDYGTGQALYTFGMDVLNGGSPLTGQFVRISKAQAPDSGQDFLSLGEVRVLGLELPSPNPNVALNKVATQTSTAFGRPAGNAVDGNFGNETHTAAGDVDASWNVDLDGSFPLKEIILNNRPSCCGSRLRDITVRVYDNPTDLNLVYESDLLNPENVLGSPATITLDLSELDITGGFVEVQRFSDPDLSGTGGVGNADEADVLSLGEVQVIADDPSFFLNLQVDRATGEATIDNISTEFGFRIDGINVTSAGGSLDGDADEIEAGWDQIAGDANTIAHGNLTDSTYIPPELDFSLGKIFNGGDEDLVFTYSMDSGEIVQGIVNYIGEGGEDSFPGLSGGDTNLIVDAEDLANLRNNFGLDSATNPEGDIAGEDGQFIGGIIGASQLAALRNNFGTNYNASAIPEPASLALLGLSGLAMLRRRRA